MKARRVRFTQTALSHLERERAWWLANREHLEIFGSEVESAIEVLGLLPGAGAAYIRGKTPDLRRIYLRKIACHLYYTFDDHEVIVRAVWGARRERGPGV